jgi:7,8-dihydropterin-6-yl-methyl-4-(beta-D-ribofuranosyl)aminobenzene 5'-phosphate synthase
MILQEIDRVSVTILMDNSTDLLLTNSAHAVRPPLTKNERYIMPLPIAEHGFSALVNTFISIEEKKEKNNTNKKVKYENNNNNQMFLFDAGPSEDGVIHNADIFGIDFNRIDGIILSHGHFDHFTGLANMLRRISLSRRNNVSIDLLVHPDAFLKRWEVYQDRKRTKMPVLDEEHLKGLGALIHKRTGITFLPSEEYPSLLVTGEIPRKTSFEKGFPIQYLENRSDNETSLVPDPLVRDDQAIVVNVRNRGLVILTGCGHAGIINTIDYAKKVTEIDKVYAVLGGFHLPADGGIYEEAIEPTMKELQKINPDYIVPCHCTGWKASNRIIEIMPEKFLQSSVGTVFTF